MTLLSQANGGSYAGYGVDEWCDRAAADIKAELCHSDVDVRFFPGATQANLIVIAAALSPVQSVICPDTGHINCHEAASVEATGHKIIALPNDCGKITAAQIEAYASSYHADGEPEYLTEPKMVYLSFPTECGTLYSKEELCAIRSVCSKYDMYLFVDGARMSYGLASEANDLSLADFAQLADVFYIGGTKCGGMFGEALVIVAPQLKRRFKAYMKQHGAVLAKSWLLGLQFAAMFESGDYYAAAKRADALAIRIKAAFVAKGVPLWADSYTNQQFVILSDAQKAELSRKYIFEEQGKTEQGTVVRFCTSWSSTQEEVDALISDIERL